MRQKISTKKKFHNKQTKITTIGEPKIATQFSPEADVFLFEALLKNEITPQAKGAREVWQTIFDEFKTKFPEYECPFNNFVRYVHSLRTIALTMAQDPDQVTKFFGACRNQAQKDLKYKAWCNYAVKHNVALPNIPTPTDKKTTEKKTTPPSPAQEKKKAAAAQDKAAKAAEKAAEKAAAEKKKEEEKAAKAAEKAAAEKKKEEEKAAKAAEKAAAAEKKKDEEKEKEKEKTPKKAAEKKEKQSKKTEEQPESKVSKAEKAEEDRKESLRLAALGMFGNAAVVDEDEDELLEQYKSKDELKKQKEAQKKAEAEKKAAEAEKKAQEKAERAQEKEKEKATASPAGKKRKAAAAAAADDEEQDAPIPAKRGRPAKKAVEDDRLVQLEALVQQLMTRIEVLENNM